MQFQREFIIFEIGQREFSFAFSLLTYFTVLLTFFFASTEKQVYFVYQIHFILGSIFFLALVYLLLSLHLKQIFNSATVFLRTFLGGVRFRSSTRLYKSKELWFGMVEKEIQKIKIEGELWLRLMKPTIRRKENYCRQ